MELPLLKSFPLNYLGTERGRERGREIHNFGQFIYIHASKHTTLIQLCESILPSQKLSKQMNKIIANQMANDGLVLRFQWEKIVIHTKRRENCRV